MEEQIEARTADLLTVNEDLRRSERSFHALAHVSPVGTFRTDAQGDFVCVNVRWCEIAGMPIEKALGKNWAEAIHSEEREYVVRKWYGSVRGTGIELAKELMAIRPDIPIMLCTGFSGLINEKQAKEMGIHEFVMKHFVIGKHATTIRKVLDRK